MSDVEQFLAVIFGSIITIAIVSVIVGKQSKAPQAIQAFGTALSSVVAAAVNPVSANYGYGNGNSTFGSSQSLSTTPGIPWQSLPLPGISQAIG